MKPAGPGSRPTLPGDKRVVVTGLAVITTLADSPAALHAALLAGESGLSHWKYPLYSGCLSKIGGDLSQYDWEGKLASLRERIPADSFRRLRRLAVSSPSPTILVMLVAAEAFADAGLFPAASPERTSAILAGHYLYDLYKLANWQAYAANPDGIDVSLGVKELDSDALACLTEVLGIGGPAYGVGGACAAGNLGLRAALDEIRHHQADAVVVTSGGHHLTPASLHSLAKLGAISLEEFDAEPARASRPFDAARNGFVPASGAAALALESLEHARRRGARIYAEILGVGVTTNGSRGPSPGEQPMACAMALALEEAKLDRSAIGYVAAHATSTQLGDLAEARAIHRVFGGHTAELKVNALKSMLGHQLSASVLVETVAILLQLRAGWLYPTINVDRLAPEIGLDVCPNQGVQFRPAFVMKNAFGFGGVNTACVLGRCDA